MLVAVAVVAATIPVFAQEDAEADSVSVSLGEVTVGSRLRGVRKPKNSALNTEVISASELSRAACCNLGESFTTNPSVDVSYSDAATGARQIKLLGLAGTYVQLLTENIPNLRGSALPYGLGYIAGPWIQSIQVSKGASSVKNGYESITGQINIEMKKPQATEEVAANVYADHMGKVELNANANVSLTDRLSTGLLVHGENSFAAHDSNNDGFADQPKIRQVALMDRWAWMGENYLFQAAAKYLNERRLGGQIAHHSNSAMTMDAAMPYEIEINTNRWEGFAKNAYIFDHENDGNVALILSGSHNSQRNTYGQKLYNVTQGNVYASLMFERKWNEIHALSTGLSLNYDSYDEDVRFVHDMSVNPVATTTRETVSGGYAQYTLNLADRLIAMAGVRYDYSSLYGSMFTPRTHVRWNVTPEWSWHLSAGRGYRSPHVMAENSALLASSRQIKVESLGREDAWNYGVGTSWTPQVADKPLRLSAEYYYTDFNRQLALDFDSDAHAVVFRMLHGQSHSHTVQVEASYQLFQDFTLTTAYRFTDVKSDMGNGLGMRQKVLTSRHKGLFTVEYAPMMGIWQFDVTCSLVGGGRLPDSYITSGGQPSWTNTYNAYAQLNAQVTRNFRYCAVYVGSENLTGYRQKNPIIGADNPWGADFDATMIYAPLHGALFYAGFRYKFEKL